MISLYSNSISDRNYKFDMPKKTTIVKNKKSSMVSHHAESNKKVIKTPNKFSASTV